MRPVVLVCTNLGRPARRANALIPPLRATSHIALANRTSIRPDRIPREMIQVKGATNKSVVNRLFTARYELISSTLTELRRYCGMPVIVPAV
jgi:hypothetical protein